MKSLTKVEAEKIVQITSSIFPQGNSWVLREWDLSTGTERLTRGLTQIAAKKRLKAWRKERLEQLLREDPNTKAYILRVWHENPSWAGQGIWQWAQHNWFTTREDAELALEKRKQVKEGTYEILETVAAEVPGHFQVVI